MFTTADDAKAHIIAVIESGDATRDEFDIEAIFTACYEYSTELQKFVPTVDGDEFWAAVEQAAR
ncbi:hypothetical protein [Arthrobacter castelli]|uniref:hypothetical protein n=1 Tax=Arthrobacter castelli TaxID=271431 RepID=UPI0004086A46|nr:hypothetical protein [Arthrobacter castelli]